jgi:predicted amidohydrolase YtcJ
MRYVLLVLVVAALYGTGQTPPAIVLLNGRVFTGVEARPWAEALAIRGDRIASVGSTSEIRRQMGNATQVIDVGGRLVIPGINDAHVHPGASPPSTPVGGPSAIEHDPTFSEIVQRLKDILPKSQKGGWITGEIGAAVLDDPAATRFALDEIAPDRLVMFTAWTGHGVLLNTAALRHFGIADDEPDPSGGFYVRMPGRRTLSGIAHEYAHCRLARRFLSEPPAEAQAAAFRQLTAAAASFGITSLQAMMTAVTIPEAVRYAGSDLPVRLRLIDFPLSPIIDWREPASRSTRGSGMITVSGTKWIVDGTPIERLMFVRDPFADRRETRGRLNFSSVELATFLQRARDAGEQPMVHAVGDAALETVLAALEQTGGAKWQSLRPRIEHGDMLASVMFERAKRLGVVVVQNPSHFMLRPLVVARLGPERVARSWMTRSWLTAGVPVAFGSDGPLNPYLNIMFATINANNPSEALTREQALVAYTRGSAFAERQEREKGTIAAGMLADIAVLSQDIFKVPSDALPATVSVLTLAGGRVVHDKLK